MAGQQHFKKTRMTLGDQEFEISDLKVSTAPERVVFYTPAVIEQVQTMLVGDVKVLSDLPGLDIVARVMGGRRTLVMRDPVTVLNYFGGIEVPYEMALRDLNPKYNWVVHTPETMPLVLRRTIDPARWASVHVGYKVGVEPYLEALEDCARMLAARFGVGPHVHEFDSILNREDQLAAAFDEPEPDWDFV